MRRSVPASRKKPFHEIILQVGNRDDMSADSEEGQLAAAVLDEYMKGFQERNPPTPGCSLPTSTWTRLRPICTLTSFHLPLGVNGGLSTRVSLKQALADQGITGEGRSLTERDLWVQKEKEALAEIMLEHGIEWEQKGRTQGASERSGI